MIPQVDLALGLQSHLSNRVWDKELLEGSDNHTLYIYSQKEGSTEKDGLASVT